MRELCALLADAFTVQGYTVSQDAALEGRSGTVYTVPLLAEGESAILLDCVLDGPLDERAVLDLVAILDDAGGDRGVLCHLGEATDEARSAAGDRVILWGRDTLVRVLGEARLAAAVGGVPAELPLSPAADGPVLAESVTELLPPAFQAEEVPVFGEAEEAALAADLFGALETAAAAAPPPAPTPLATTASEPAPFIQPPPQRGAEPGYVELPGAAAAADPRGPSHPLLPVRITPEEAKKRVRDRLFGVGSHDLVLQPVHLYDYECDVLKEGSLRYDTVDGRVEVNGTDKAVREVDPDEANPQGRSLLASTQGFEVHEKVLRVSEERARGLALETVLQRHTRSVEMKTPEPDKGYHYFERKKVAPRPDHVRLKHLGVFHRVLWRLHGTNGEVDLDALDGRVVAESVRNANPDAMMLE